MLEYQDQEIVLIHYSNQGTKGMKVAAKIIVGNLEVIDMDFRRYVVVNPEFQHVPVGSNILTGERHPLTPPLIIQWRGYYLIKMDINLIKEDDVYKCWKEMLMQIVDFVEKNGFLPSPRPYIPTMEQVQGDIRDFLHALRNAK